MPKSMQPQRVVEIPRSLVAERRFGPGRNTSIVPQILTSVCDRESGTRPQILVVTGDILGSTTNDVRGVARKVFLGMAPVSNDLPEMSPRRTDVRRGQVTPLAYHRPRYPLPSCTSAELDSVFPGSSSLTFAIGSPQRIIGYRSHA